MLFPERSSSSKEDNSSKRDLAAINSFEVKFKFDKFKLSIRSNFLEIQNSFSHYSHPSFIQIRDRIKMFASSDYDSSRPYETTSGQI